MKTFFEVVGGIFVWAVAALVFAWAWSIISTRLEDRADKMRRRCRDEARKSIGINIMNDAYWLGANPSAYCTMMAVGKALAGHGDYYFGLDMWQFREKLFAEIVVEEATRPRVENRPDPKGWIKVSAEVNKAVRGVSPVASAMYMVDTIAGALNIPVKELLRGIPGITPSSPRCPDCGALEQYHDRHHLCRMHRDPKTGLCTVCGAPSGSLGEMLRSLKDVEYRSAALPGALAAEEHF